MRRETLVINKQTYGIGALFCSVTELQSVQLLAGLLILSDCNYKLHNQYNQLLGNRNSEQNKALTAMIDEHVELLLG